MANPDTIEKKVDRILYYLENDEKTGRKGLYDQIQDAIELGQDNRTEIDKIKTQTKVLLSVFGVISGGVGFLIKLFW